MNPLALQGRADAGPWLKWKPFCSYWIRRSGGTTGLSRKEWEVWSLWSWVPPPPRPASPPLPSTVTKTRLGSFEFLSPLKYVHTIFFCNFCKAVDSLSQWLLGTCTQSTTSLVTLTIQTHSIKHQLMQSLQAPQAYKAGLPSVERNCGSPQISQLALMFNQSLLLCIDWLPSSWRSDQWQATERGDDQGLSMLHADEL